MLSKYFEKYIMNFWKELRAKEMWNCTAQCKSLSPLQSGVQSLLAQKPNHIHWQESFHLSVDIKKTHNMLFSQFEISYYLISKSARIQNKILIGQMKEFPAEGTHFTNYNLEYTAQTTKALEQA